MLDPKDRRLFSTILFTMERLAKEALFGCHSCGQCVLKSTMLVCPMQCSKQLRNGPCGGSMNGRCEIDENKKCAWDQIYRRAEKLGMLDKLEEINPMINWTLKDTSAWLNIISGHINSRGHALYPEKGKSKA